MTPVTPTVQRVSPRCYQCGAEDQKTTYRDAEGNRRAHHTLIVGDGVPICSTCVRVGVRLADMQTDPPSIHDDDVREGWRK